MKEISISNFVGTSEGSYGNKGKLGIIVSLRGVYGMDTVVRTSEDKEKEIDTGKKHFKSHDRSDKH